MVLAQGNKFPPFAMVQDKYEEETTRLLKRILGPGMTFLDVGAHVGYYTLLAARQVGPTGRVFCFEPEPSNYDLLVGNIQLNGYANIQPINKAVSNRVGFTTLFLTGLDNGRHSTYRHQLPESGSVEVETTTVDAFFESKGWPHVDLVKIDVEGAEMDVLDGMNQLLQKSECPNLIVEFNPYLLRSAGSDLLHFLDRPASWGFRIDCIDEKSGLSSLETMDARTLVDRLMVAESSVNLYWSKE